MIRLRWWWRSWRWPLLLALSLAVGWWLLALMVRASDVPIFVWIDQDEIFLRPNLADPYATPSFVNPPWAWLPLLPFSLLPLPLAVLTQLALYFALLTLLIFKHGGNIWATLIVLTSPFALDNALELNIDWIVCLGMLAPPLLRGPLLAAKPQVALGYVLGTGWRSFWRAFLGGLMVLLLSLTLWGAWPLAWLEALELTPVSWAINLSPRARMGDGPALVLGVLLTVWAIRRRDAVLATLGWVCFVPYLAGYSLLLPFALIAARWPLVAGVSSVTLWVALIALLRTTTL